MKEYTYWQIKKLLAEQNLYLEKLFLYKHHISKYCLKDEKGNIVASPITLDGIRKVFKDFDYPMD